MMLKSKRIKIILAVTLIFLLGIGIGFALGQNTLGHPLCLWHSPQYAVPSVQQVVPAVVQSEVQDFVGDFAVARVIDGDTIEIAGGKRVRYIGMDTPETVDPKKPVQCFGPQASEENKKLVAGQTVRLERDTTDRDQFGRLLRYVFVGDNFINLDLVQQGFARVATFAPDTRYQSQFTAAQQSAQKADLGLWSACSQNYVK